MITWNPSLFTNKQRIEYRKKLGVNLNGENANAYNELERISLDTWTELDFQSIIDNKEFFKLLFNVTRETTIYLRFTNTLKDWSASLVLEKQVKNVIQDESINNLANIKNDMKDIIKSLKNNEIDSIERLYDQMNNEPDINSGMDLRKREYEEYNLEEIVIKTKFKSNSKSKAHAGNKMHLENILLINHLSYGELYKKHNKKYKIVNEKFIDDIIKLLINDINKIDKRLTKIEDKNKSLKMSYYEII